MEEKKYERISAFEPLVLIVSVIFSVLSAIICMQIIGKVGFTPNTSLIGGIAAMLIARIPIKTFMKFRSLERQNFVQTMMSGAGFAAANSALLPLSIFFILGETSFLIPMAIGCLVGVSISIFIVGKLFDSAIYPADAAWPAGVATAVTLEAGDEGGKKGVRLIQGLVIGAIASYFKIPAAGIGIAFIANIFSMIALGLGLVIRAYTKDFIDFDIVAANIPSGVMVGAGLVALIQSIIVIIKTDKIPKEKVTYTVTGTQMKKRIALGFFLFLLGAVAVALISGIFSQMSATQCVIWVLWAAISSTLTMLLVGMAAMHSGWFPAFAITTIFMTFAIFMGFPLVPIALLTGYVSSVGPCFADMGFDLKTGWLLRGNGKNREDELYGRKQQVNSQLLGGVIGVGIAVLTMNLFFEAKIMPPVSQTFADTISAAANPDAMKQLLLWAIPGAIIQFAFGPSKMVGVLFATGLLINSPIYGVAILIAVVFRLIFGNKFMEVRDAGLIAGDGIYGFFSLIFKAF